MVSWLCLCVYAREILNGRQPGPWDQARAERFARGAAVREEFLALAHRPEQEIADTFGVPRERVNARLLEPYPAPAVISRRLA